VEKFFTRVPSDLQELRVHFEKGAIQSDSADSHRSILQRNPKLLLSTAGGFLGAATLARAEIYNPDADTWTPTSMTNAPSARGPSAVWTGSLMLIGGLLE